MFGPAPGARQRSWSEAIQGFKNSVTGGAATRAPAARNEDASGSKAILTDRMTLRDSLRRGGRGHLLRFSKGSNRHMINLIDNLLNQITTLPMFSPPRHGI
jgi:hypothetical protein